MPEHLTWHTTVTVTMDCCRRPVALQVPFTLVHDPEAGCAQISTDQLALRRAVTVHLDHCGTERPD